MIQIEFHRNFVKSYDKRIKPNAKLAFQTQLRVNLFRKNPLDEILRDHKLAGSKRGYRSFSITGDIRIIYEMVSERVAIFYDIGSHNQVYK
ncbi:MAG: type II toxin-antitoxin system mRNA interferase toxin, RelE/StbE family [Microgenomates group bacterium]